MIELVVMLNEPVQALSIGCVVESSLENRSWRDAIRAVTRRIADARGDADSPLSVNVVFHVPGRTLKPEFDGVRTGRYSKANQLLMVQVAVPELVPEDPDEYLLDAVSAAIAE